jgi:hypothetical protein
MIALCMSHPRWLGEAWVSIRKEALRKRVGTWQEAARRRQRLLKHRAFELEQTCGATHNRFSKSARIEWRSAVLSISSDRTVH